MVSAHQARKVFEPGEQGVRDASFTINAGTATAIVGPSGSGKTTLMTLLGLLEKPDSGELTLFGHPASSLVATQSAQIRRHELGFIFQAFHLIQHLNVFENVMLGIHPEEATKKDRKQRVADQLKALGLETHASAFPKTLSGGQQQRVAIARALVRRPKLLLCDEPTGNLDSTNGEIVIQAILNSVSANSAVVIVTHDESLAARCTHQIRVKDGLASGEPQ
ncbi:hypothetical protein BHE16_08845 [Neomicrococcus aestuarii]|uniref:ABC transporter domain-containing protein n=1 Tax=Neomicrococcus aestuarii TaxID=556325 RepID=A0A1L2ZRY5_9MICC|nr:hypothetical protein BHE16_08845 [Neomicrococcus aestuarii]